MQTRSKRFARWGVFWRVVHYPSIDAMQVVQKTVSPRKRVSGDGFSLAKCQLRLFNMIVLQKTRSFIATSQSLCRTVRIYGPCSSISSPSCVLCATKVKRVYKMLNWPDSKSYHQVTKNSTCIARASLCGVRISWNASRTRSQTDE